MSSEVQLEGYENKDRQHLGTTVDGRGAYATLNRDEGRIIFLHTYVPPELEGRSIAASLAEHAVAYARAYGLVVVPPCPDVRSYTARHPEYQLVGKS